MPAHQALVILVSTHWPWTVMSCTYSVLYYAENYRVTSVSHVHVYCNMLKQDVLLQGQLKEEQAKSRTLLSRLSTMEAEYHAAMTAAQFDDLT